MLENFGHTESFFFTLTYDQEHYPHDGNLEPAKITDFLKRARYYSDKRLRYYVVGEYGSHTKRAHYHGIFFGTADTSIVLRAWQYGFVHFGTVSASSIGYVCGYVTKKLKGAYYREQGKVPEFSRMSLKPGIGSNGLKQLVDFFHTREGALILAETGDVPSFIRWQQQKWPIGRYLKIVLRRELGFANPDKTPESIVAQVAGQRAALLSDDRDHFDRERVQAGHIAQAKLRTLRTRETL